MWVVVVGILGLLVLLLVFGLVLSGGSKGEGITRVVPEKQEAGSETVTSRVESRCGQDTKLYQSVAEALATTEAVCRLVLYQVNEVPADIGQLTNLKELIVRQSKFALLPSVIGDLTGLYTLDLSQNAELISLPSELGALGKLKTLNISNTGITSLPSEVAQLGNLEVIITHVGQLSDQQKEFLKSALAELLIVETDSPAAKSR